jgi:hypothetical protein
MLHVVSESAGAPARFQDANAYCDIDPTSSTLVCTSDRRLKENIESLDSATVLSHLAELRPVSFVWKSDASHTERTGLIAQEVAEVFPDLVTTDSVTGYKSVAYGGFTPYLLAGVGELAKERTQLAALLATGTSTFASTSPFYELVNAQDTVWSRMATLAHNFVDGVLTLSGVKANRVDVGDMLCVGDVCVDEETFLNMVQQAGQSGGGGGSPAAPEEPPAEEPPTEEDPLPEPPAVEEPPAPEEPPAEEHTPEEPAAETP